MATSKELDKTEGVTTLDVSDPRLREFAQMVNLLPQSDPNDAMLSIVAQIAGADDPTALDSPWLTDDVEQLIGVWIDVQSVKAMPSTYAGGLSVFLVVTAARPDTGELVTFTTGSVSIVAQLVKAFAAGWLPLPCKIVRASRESSNGYFPMHLEINRPELGRRIKDSRG